MAQPSRSDLADYCRRMAMATYDLAEQTDAPEILAKYLEIAAAWLRRADSEARPGDGPPAD